MLAFLSLFVSKEERRGGMGERGGKKYLFSFFFLRFLESNQVGGERESTNVFYLCTSKKSWTEEKELCKRGRKGRTEGGKGSVSSRTAALVLWTHKRRRKGGREGSGGRGKKEGGSGRGGDPPYA